MEYPVSIPNFDANFEGIKIYVKDLLIQKYDDVLLSVFPTISPYTSVWHDMNVNGMPTYKDLAGTLTVFFRSQGTDQGLTLSLESHIRIKAAGDTMAADSFCKLIQFIFEWTDKWITDNDIRDRFNEKFAIPRFLYSKSHFEAAFPQ